MLRLGWLHDHRLEERPGGAQLNETIMAKAAPCWVEIVRCYPGQMRAADAYVLHNVKFFSRDELEIALSKPYIKIEHDYWNCVQRWQRDWVLPVMNGARAVIFLSPLHRDVWLRRPGMRPQRVFLVPSPLEPEPWLAAARQAKERRGVIWLGEFQPHKGVVEACRWAARHEPVDVYGFGPLHPQGPGVHVRGYLAYKDVPATLARYKRFLFLPRWQEPFGRTVAEAVLAGCELICNANVGALSWGWKTREEWAAAVSEAPQLFWKIVRGVLA